MLLKIAKHSPSLHNAVYGICSKNSNTDKIYGCTSCMPSSPEALVDNEVVSEFKATSNLTTGHLPLTPYPQSGWMSLCMGAMFICGDAVWIGDLLLLGRAQVTFGKGYFPIKGQGSDTAWR